MSNTINVNGMTSYYRSFISSVTKQKAGTSGTKGEQNSVSGSRDSFASTLSSKVKTTATNEVETMDESKAVSTKDMTLEEYKNYIHDKISEFSLHPDLMGDSISIHISDDGFKAMQNDPEYENWVLQDIKTGFATPLPGWCRAMSGNQYIVANYGATREECNCTSWSMAYKGGTGDKVWEAQSKGSFWTKRGEQKKVQDKIDKKVAEKKELEEKWLQEAAEKRRAYTDFLNGKISINTNSISEFGDFFQMPPDPKVAGILSAYEAGSFAGGGLI